MSTIIYWIKESILIPCFGAAWLEVSAWIFLLFFLLLVGVSVYLVLKYSKTKEELSRIRGYVNIVGEKNRDLTQDKTDLEQTIKFIKKQLEKEKNSNEALNIKLDEYSITEAKLNADLAEANSQIIDLKNTIDKYSKNKTQGKRATIKKEDNKVIN